MHACLALLFALSQPFWETKPPEQWTAREVDLMRTASPWTRTAGPGPEVLVWLATAQPIEEAESEARLHARNPLRQPDPDYVDFLAANRETAIVLAVQYPR